MGEGGEQGEPVRVSRLAMDDISGNSDQPKHPHPASSSSDSVSRREKALRVLTIPALSDNYIFLLTDGTHAVCIDPGEAAPVERALAEHGLTLDAIWLTHHHNDHIGGAEALRAKHGCRIIGFAGDAHRLPPLDETVHEGSRLHFAGEQAEVWETPGHTLGHVAYVFRKPAILFCGDTLFLGGCGRLFEGTAEQMFQALRRFLSLPGETILCCAHEYTETNYRFARSIFPEDEAVALRLDKALFRRHHNMPTVPERLDGERLTNPFLCAVADGDPVAFTALRAARNHWS